MTVDLQASEIETPKAEKETLKNFQADQDATCETSKIHQKCRDLFTGLLLHYDGVASRVLKSVLACCARETSEVCPFDSARKRRESRMGKTFLPIES